MIIRNESKIICNIIKTLNNDELTELTTELVAYRLQRDGYT